MRFEFGASTGQGPLPPRVGWARSGAQGGLGGTSSGTRSAAGARARPCVPLGGAQSGRKRLTCHPVVARAFCSPLCARPGPVGGENVLAPLFLARLLSALSRLPGAPPQRGRRPRTPPPPRGPPGDSRQRSARPTPQPWPPCLRSDESIVFVWLQRVTRGHERESPWSAGARRHD